MNLLKIAKLKRLLIILSAIAFLSCSTDQTRKLENKTLTCQKEKVIINANYPFATGYPKGEEINPSVDTLLRSFFSSGEKVDFGSTFDQLIHSIDTMYTNSEYSTMSYELSVNWQAYYNDDILSLNTSSLIYTGGAHPITIVDVKNFFQSTGKLLNIIDYIADKELFRKTIIEHYISQYDLPSDATKEQTGLFVELSELPIPNNIMFTTNGLSVIYNQYEIAPYVMGITILEISYDNIKFKEGININNLIHIGDATK